MIIAKEIYKGTGNGTGAAFSNRTSGLEAIQATISGTGSVGCTVTIQCSLDAVNWINLGTITLSGTTTATDGFVAQVPWIHYRAVVSGSSGTITSISVAITDED